MVLASIFCPSAGRLFGLILHRDTASQSGGLPRQGYWQIWADGRLIVAAPVHSLTKAPVVTFLQHSVTNTQAELWISSFFSLEYEPALQGWRDSMAFKTFGTRGAVPGTPISIQYIDKPGLGKIALLNALLFVLTLTLYRFWAKTNIRRHIWSCVHINGEPLEYTGRGVELFLGALIVFGLFVLPIFATVLTLQLWLGPEHPALILVNLFILLFVLVFWGMALYRARRYQLSRTLWRGIRGALVGSSWTYSMLYFGATLLRGMT